MSNTAGMAYEATAIKQTKGLGKKVVLRQLDHIGTPTILWFLAKRHKTGILAFWAISLTVVQLFPFVPALIFSAIQGF